MELRELVDKLQSQVDYLIKRNQELEQIVTRNNVDIEDLAQYIRRESLEVHGIPDRFEQRDLEPFLIRLGKAIGVPFSSYEVAACHRLGRRSSEKYAPVVIKFTNRKYVQDLMDARHLLSWKTKHMFGNLFFTESLVAPRRRLVGILNHYKKLGLIASFGSHNGLPFFKRTINENKITVASIADIDKYFERGPTKNTNIQKEQNG